MKKNLFFAPLAAATLLACTILMGSGMIYFATLLLALAIVVVLHSNRKKVMHLTRWAKTNPKKAQGAITVLSVISLALALVLGNTIRELGYEMPLSPIYVYSAIMLLGFLSVPFLPQSGTIIIPKELNRQRLSYLGIILSGMMVAVVMGNRVGTTHPESRLAQTLDAVDEWIVQEEAVPFINEAPLEQIKETASSDVVLTAVAVHPKKAPDHSASIDGELHPDMSKKELRKAKKKQRREMRKKFRRMLGAGACIGAILLITFIAIPLLCGGVCLIISAIGGSWGIGGGIGYSLLGLIMIGGSITGSMYVRRKWCKSRKKKKKKKKKNDPSNEGSAPENSEE